MLFTSGSPYGLMIVGVLFIITGITFIFWGNIGPGLFILIPGIVFLTIGICLKKHYQPKPAIKSLFGPCRYDQDNDNNKKTSFIRKK